MIANRDADRVRESLSEMGQIQPPNPKYRTKAFMEFVIDSIDVDTF